MNVYNTLAISFILAQDMRFIPWKDLITTHLILSTVLVVSGRNFFNEIGNQVIGQVAVLLLA